MAAVDRTSVPAGQAPRATGGRLRLLAGIVAGVMMVGSAGCTGNHATTSYAPLRHPFRGATLLVDTDTLAANWQQEHDATWLEPITRTPQARWLTGPDDLTDLPEVIRATRQAHALLVVVPYYIPNLDCAGPMAGAADATAYDAWIDKVIAVLGDNPAAVILEPDAVASDCFDDARAAILASATRKLTAAGHFVYLDAGHPRWRDPEDTAKRLRAAGIQQAEGFSINVSNRQSTSDSHRWGLAVSTLVGDRDMVIDTSRNGLPAPADDDWCNPARQGLGERPTTDPRLDRVAALLWIKSPGETDGQCGHDRGDGMFVPRQARTLIVNAPWVSDSARRSAAAAQTPPA